MSTAQQPADTLDPDRIAAIIKKAKRVAMDYRKVTGKPLGITGEIGEYEAATLLNLDLATARTPGYDARDSRGRRYQIKTRVIFPASKPGQRLGRIKLDTAWDYVLLVLLDEQLEPIEIHRATRTAVSKALAAPGSKSRNVRGQLGVSKFKSIGRRVWPSAN